VGVNLRGLLDNGWNMPRRIVHIIIRLDTGGAEKSLQRLLLAASQSTTDIQHAVICLGPSTPISQAIEASGVAVECHDIHRLNPIALWRALRSLRRESPALLQGWTYLGNITASLFALVLGATKVAWNVRSSPTQLHRLSVPTRFALWLSRVPVLHPQMVLFNSHAAVVVHAQHGFSWANPARVEHRVVPNSIDPNVFKPDASAASRLRARYPQVAAGTPWVGLVGRFHAAKGIEHFLAALARLRSQGTSVCGVLAGPGMTVDNGELVSMLESEGLAGSEAHGPSVLCLGPQDNLASIFPGLDVLVLASLWESTPNVLLEAMACGVTTVATRVGDVPQILLDTHRQAVPGDVPSLVRAIEYALDHPVAPDGADRQRVLERFHVDRTLAHYTDIYTALVDTALTK